MARPKAVFDKTMDKQNKLFVVRPNLTVWLCRSVLISAYKKHLIYCTSNQIT